MLHAARRTPPATHTRINTVVCRGGFGYRGRCDWVKRGLAECAVSVEKQPGREEPAQSCRGGRGGDTDVEGLQEGHPDLPTTTVSMERQE